MTRRNFGRLDYAGIALAIAGPLLLRIHRKLRSKP